MKTIFTGRVTADPVIRYNESDKPVAYFRIAIKDGKKDSYTNCTAWGGLAQIIGEYICKGRLVAVEGVLDKHTYTDKKGKKCTWEEIRVDSLQMLDFKPGKTRPRRK